MDDDRLYTDSGTGLNPQGDLNQPARLNAIAARWAWRLEEWRRLHATVDGAAIASEVLADLEQVAAESARESLTLSDAARVSGYSPDHLARLVREGKLANHGRKGAPRFLRADLPIRPGKSVAAVSSRAYDPNTDARSLRVRR
jgi:hypothetical protein